MTNEINGKGGSDSLRFFKDWVIPIAVALFVAVIIHKFLIFKVYIPSESMYPALTNGDHLFVKRIYNYDKIKRQDIIVFNFKEGGKEELLIKRVIGLPGDTVKIDNQGKVFINGEELNEPYVKNESNLAGEFKVPEGKYFFLGDNRSNSYDSRRWKDPFIDKNDIKGKAFVRVYPFNRIGLF
ncbi:signal peptidase I [Clostridium frigidicarnis]|uniref:Signal peptidase I n=1 Tax=Clostridium frigidicarnis TaxID=84698 RepID=A0A1I0ZXW0_9CLOT|nr:signal peptidase I [Clostridium frigidicarnis]SFB29906.1 signal peptidase I [Clostridium frigidicarnis]